MAGRHRLLLPLLPLLLLLLAGLRLLATDIGAVCLLIGAVVPDVSELPAPAETSASPSNSVLHRPTHISAAHGRAGTADAQAPIRVASEKQGTTAHL